MATVKFNYNSQRSQEARLTVGVKPIWRKILKLGGWLIIISGLTLVGIQDIIGWLLIGAGTIMLAVYSWWRWRLYRLEPIEDNDYQIDNILSSSVLGRLGRNPSPRQLATVVAQTSNGMFLLVRFGLSPRFLYELTSDNSLDMPAIWESALEIRQQTDSKMVSGGVLTLALLKSIPNIDQLLAKLQLHYQDLEQGVRWHDYLHAIKEDMSKPLHTGGIARDWSFGYIPLLQKFGTNISAQLANRRLMLLNSKSHQSLIDQMIEVFANNGRQNVALVGPDGVGKTTLVYSLAARLMNAKSDLPASLKSRQIILLDASSLISAAPGRGELEYLTSQILAEAANAKNVIVCLDNAQLFFQEGIGSVDLSNILQPILDTGNLRIILTISEQEMFKINQLNPQLTNTLNKIMVRPASEMETMVALQDKSLPLESSRKVIYMYQALKEAYRLGERYVYDLAMPGRAIKLLEAAVNYNQNGLVTVQSVQQAVEQTMNVKVSTVNQSDERDKLLNLETLIHQLMVNQTRAVKVVSDAIRRARAGVANKNKPIGTFLFLGPTGVGKTELAKALSAVYFGGESEIIRLDLNEYVTTNDVARMIADGSSNPHSLTAQIMQRPFSVVLLDEIEKAHPAVLSTLLQLLDEGILRDQNNREVSFRDAIIIATSNAGSDRIREYIDRGYDIAKFEGPFVDELISSQQFRPEFLNRFDEIVVFRPLHKPELLQILELILGSVNKTLSNQKIAVEVDQDAKEYLVEAGYDPRLGARPMRRIVQSTVENIVAKQMIAGGDLAGSVIRVSLDQVKDLVQARQQADELIKR